MSEASAAQAYFDPPDPVYTCYECGAPVDEDDTVWIDPASRQATTGDDGRSYHVECAPGELEEEPYDLEDYMMRQRGLIE